MSTPTRLAAYGPLIPTLAAYIYTTIRIMPFAKDLPEHSAGLRRLLDFLWQPANRIWSRANYTEEGQRLVPWLRATAVLAMIAIVVSALV